VAFAHQADIALAEQALLEETGLQPGQQANGQVHPAVGQVVLERGGGAAHRAQAHAGRRLAQVPEQARQEVDLADVGHPHGEGPLAGGGVKVAALLQRAADQTQGLAHRFAQLLRIGRGLHAARRAHEELVAQQLAQPRQRIAHRGLRDAQLERHPRDAAVFQQVVEDLQQVQIQPVHSHII